MTKQSPNMVQVKHCLVSFLILSGFLIEASQSSTGLVRLQNRVKRDLDIFAACDTKCISEEELTDYDVLLEYEYEEEKHNSFFTYRSQPEAKPKTCIRACKFADPNQNVDFKDLSLDAYTVTAVKESSSDSKKDKEEFLIKSSERINDNILPSIENTTLESLPKETEFEQLTATTADSYNATKSSVCNCNGSITMSPTSTELKDSTMNDTQYFSEDEFDEDNTIKSKNKTEPVFKSIGIDSALLSQLLQLINQSQLTTENQDRKNYLVGIEKTTQSNPSPEILDAITKINKTTTERQNTSIKITNETVSPEKDLFGMVRIVPKKIRYTVVEAELEEAENIFGNKLTKNTEIMNSKNVAPSKDSSNESISETTAPELNTSLTDVYKTSNEVNRHFPDVSDGEFPQMLKKPETTSKVPLTSFLLTNLPITSLITPGTSMTSVQDASSFVGSTTDKTTSAKEEIIHSSAKNPSIPLDKIKFDFKYAISKHENISFFVSNGKYSENHTDGVQTGSPNSEPYIIEPSSIPVEVVLDSSSNETTLLGSTLSVQPTISSSTVPQFSPTIVKLGTRKEYKDGYTTETIINHQSTEKNAPINSKNSSLEVKSPTEILAIKSTSTSNEPEPDLLSIVSLTTRETTSFPTSVDSSTESVTFANSLKSTEIMPNKSLKVLTHHERPSYPTETTTDLFSSSGPNNSTFLDADSANSSIEDVSNPPTIYNFDLNTTLPLSSSDPTVKLPSYGPTDSSVTLENTFRFEDSKNISTTVGLNSSVRDGKNESNLEEAIKVSSSTSDDHSWLKDPSLPNLSDLALAEKLNFPDFLSLKRNEPKTNDDMLQNNSDISEYQKTQRLTTVRNI